MEGAGQQQQVGGDHQNHDPSSSAYYGFLLLGNPEVAAQVVAALWWVVNAIPTPLVNLAHGLYVCAAFYPLIAATSPHWLASMVLSVGACVVGATVRYILLGMPVEWLASDTVIPTYIVTWLMVNYLGVGRLILHTPFKVVFTGLEMIHKARTITGAIDLTVKTFTQPVWVGPILIGTLASCAGSFYRGFVEDSMIGIRSPSELSQPTNSIKFGFWISIFYFFSTDPYHVFHQVPPLTKDVALLCVIYYLVIVGVAAAIVGPFTPFPISVFDSLAPGDSSETKPSKPASSKKDKKGRKEH